MIENICEVRVIYADTDAMGIVYHTNYIKWFEIGRTEFLREIGYPYARMEREKIWLPVVSANCNYKVPAVYDDMLEIHSKVANLKAATIVMSYEIYRKETGELLVNGETKHAITDPQLKPIRLKTVNPELYETLMGY